MIATAKELIKIFKDYKPEKEFVITWWTDEDFIGLDQEKAFDNCERALDTSIGDINDYVSANSEDDDETN